MTGDSRVADPDDEDSLPRPAWEDTPDETDIDRAGAPRRTAAGRTTGTADLPHLLGPLCAATDALARLDARAGIADDATKAGLRARLAYTEAAGCLAHAHAWAHPLDLALQDLGLTASPALAATGAPSRALPQTFTATANTAAWADAPLDDLPTGDAAMAEALALARALRRLSAQTVSSTTAVIEALQAFGAAEPDPAALATWWNDVVPQPATRRRRFGERAGQGAAPPLPPLLTAAQTARRWMEAGITACPTPGQALLLAAIVLARTGALQAVVLPVWAAYPALGFGDGAALPRLRSDAADRLVGRGQPVTWPLAFLHLVADSARMGLRDLDRLEAAAEKGRALTAGLDRRSRLPDAIDALLRHPVLSPNALAKTLRIAPQTATALVRELQEKGVVREVTGRGRFRAFAL